MFPNVKNRKFTDLANNHQVTVIDQFENIAILDNSTRIDVKKLLDPGFFDEYIDPKNFLGESNYQIFAEKIKSIPNETLQNMKDEDDTIITNYDPEEEKRMMLEKAKQMQNPINSIQNQLDKFKDLMDEETPIIINVQRDTVETEFPTQPKFNQSSGEINMNNYSQTVQEPISRNVQQNFQDPILTMFNNVKRNTEFSLTIDIKNKIPRPDFIEMMEDSYETSIIEYLANEFTQSILKNPDSIKQSIVKEINKIVYGDKPIIGSEKVSETESKPPIKAVEKKVVRKRQTKKQIQTND